MIRPLSITDASEVAAVLQLILASQQIQHVQLEHRDSMTESDENAQLSFKMNLADEDAYYFVAETDGQITGYIMLREMSDQSCMLDDLGVIPRYRRQGIGTALVEFGIDWARRRNLTTIKLITQHANDAAVATYRKAGLVETGGENLGFGKQL